MSLKDMSLEELWEKRRILKVCLFGPTYGMGVFEGIYDYMKMQTQLAEITEELIKRRQTK